MWIALILLANVLWEDLPSSADLPRDMLDRDWIVDALTRLPIGFESFLGSHTALTLFSWLTALLLGLATVGLCTRWTVPLATLAYLVFGAILRDYSWYFHQLLTPLYALALLSVTPCGDAWSLDRWHRRRRGLPVVQERTPAMVYGLSRYLVWMAIAIPYVLAGLSKLRNAGFEWAGADNVRRTLLRMALEPMQFSFEGAFELLRAPDWVLQLLGFLTLAIELSFVLVLVSRLARRILPLLAIGMHGGILATQNILFPDLFAVHAVFYDWSPLRDRLTALLGRTSASATAPATTRSPEAGSQRHLVWVARAFLVTTAMAWAVRVEHFPFTAMQMFSGIEPSPVEYVRAYAVSVDGTRRAARCERWIGAMADTRYRKLFRQAARAPERRRVLAQFLDACARRAALGRRAERIRRFELEFYRWDVRAHPDDPRRGALVDVFIHHVGSANTAPPSPRSRM